MQVRRPLPLVTPTNEFFWRGGAAGELRFKRCTRCQNYIHPPAPVCSECLCMDLVVEAVSGRATLAAYTVNHQPWLPDFPPPYIIAIIEIEEQPSVRLTTNIVNCDEDDLEIGMPLRVVFEACDDVHIPLFEPVRP